MTKVKQINDSLFWTEKIKGYTFNVLHLASGYISFQAPFGDTPKTKKMFDTLVYHRKNLYQGKDLNKIRQDIKSFITNHN